MPIIPSSWSQEVQDRFIPVKSLGVGGFGSVWLARRKTDNDSTNDNESNQDIAQQQDQCSEENNDSTSSDLVAIKVVGHPHNQKISSFLEASEAGYFHREVSVLREISHHRIIKCLEVFEDHDPNSSCAPFCMVLEYFPGPTVEQMLDYGGCLGIFLAQEISSQLIDAVSYLHGRAVMHRDIKPDNIIVSGANLDDEACWSDDTEGENAAKSMRWNIKLIDFGFARPLRPDDIKNYEKFFEPKLENRDDFQGNIDGELDSKSLHKSSSKGSLDLSSSISKFKLLDISSVGNRNFAAPEVKKSIHRARKGDKNDEKQRQSLTEYVSDYGMIADAFSVGATIRYMCTGVPPDMSVDEFMQEYNAPIMVLFRMIGKMCCGKGKNNGREKKYRSNRDLPPTAVRLISGLTHWNEKKRTSVRSARDYEWITSSFSMENSEGYPFEIHGNHHLDFLKCAMEVQ